MEELLAGLLYIGKIILRLIVEILFEVGDILIGDACSRKGNKIGTGCKVLLVLLAVAVVVLAYLALSF